RTRPDPDNTHHPTSLPRSPHPPSLHTKPHGSRATDTHSTGWHRSSRPFAALTIFSTQNPYHLLQTITQRLDLSGPRECRDAAPTRSLLPSIHPVHQHNRLYHFLHTSSMVWQ